MKMNVEWKGKMAFEGKSESGVSLIVDATPSVGGEGKGQTPMQAVLTALGGCTGIDVISILTKMRNEPETFSIDIQAERASEHPKIFTGLHINYKLTGDNLEESKVRKAINLTQEKYCSVSKSLKAEITYSFEINGEKFE